MNNDEASIKRPSLASQADVAREVWENLEDETRRRELSHWRGVGKYSDDARWLDIGRKTVRSLDVISRVTKRPWRVEGRPLRILEWGPGGGANAFALGRSATEYYGVDISKPNLTEASRMLEAEGINSFRAIHLTNDIDSVRTQVSGPIDVFLSTAVFQHFPSQEYAIAVLKEIRAICAPGAIGFIQIRYEDGRFRGLKDVADYKKNFITATSFEVGDFAKICVGVGLSPIIMMDINYNVNYITFCLRAAPQRKVSN